MNRIHLDFGKLLEKESKCILSDIRDIWILVEFTDDKTNLCKKR